MEYAFLDTNALLKLYHTEKGSTWVKTFVIGKQVIISELTFAESATTLSRLYRDGIYTKRQAARLYFEIESNRSNYTVIPLELVLQLNQVVILAFNLPTGLRIRSLDALQLIAAKKAQSEVIALDPLANFSFVSSDAQLLKVAQAQSFVTENPEDYP